MNRAVSVCGKARRPPWRKEPSPRTGKRILERQRRRPQSASGRSSFPAETANGPLHPPQTAENRGCSAETGNSGLAQDCVVGPGGLEPATRRLWSEGIPRRRGTRGWRRTAWWGPRGLEPATRRLSAPASKMLAERTGILLRTERYCRRPGVTACRDPAPPARCRSGAAVVTARGVAPQHRRIPDHVCDTHRDPM
jgi:hypothetical protein